VSKLLDNKPLKARVQYSCNKALDNGYFYPVTARLNVFRDDTHWALIIEVVGFNYRAGGHNGIYNALHCYGNGINTKPGLSDENLLNPTQDGVPSVRW
jgi:hypothetical protein